MNDLLVPVDFSDCTDGLVAQAGALAAQLGVGITLLHAIQPPHDAEHAQLPEGIYGAALLAEESAAKLQKYAGILADQGVACRRQTWHGAPGEAILAASEALEPSMILMGTHGRKGLARMLLGSVAEFVIRRASVPVVTVRAQHHPACSAASCEVCSAHRTDTEVCLLAELDPP